MKARRAIFGIASVLGLIVLAIYTVKVARKQDYTDFLVYYRAATRAAQGDWAHVYDLADGASPFRYAPVTLPWFRPLAELSRQAAQLVWFYLQYAWFALGFVLLHRGLRALGASAHAALVATFVSALMILRFCLDCFTIGQVSSLLFVGYCLAFVGWCEGRPTFQGAGLFVPTLFKIGPGFLFLLFPFRRRMSGERPQAGPLRPSRALSFPIWLLAASALLTILWLGSARIFWRLSRDWIGIVAGDSTYYDASHYGSQSLKSALLRMVKAGQITEPHAMALLWGFAFLFCAGIALFWALRQPRTRRGLGLFFALGVFPYLWFMPETFKYSLTVLAIPIALLVLSPPKERLAWLALAVTALTLSAAGLDIVGAKLFFALQYASVPLLATALLAEAVFQQAWRDSEPSDLYREIRGHFPGRKVGPWELSPRTSASLETSVLVPVPLRAGEDFRDLSDLCDPRGALARTLQGIPREGAQEVLLIPYRTPSIVLPEDAAPGLRALERLAKTFPDARMLAGNLPTTRALALRAGFLASNGKFLFAVQAEQPCDSEFYARAIERLRQHGGLVRANRRLSESRFRVPVRLLSMVYGRHRLGLLFNRLVRAVLPVKTTDTQSGSWAISRELAREAFAVQGSPDFLFDLELALTAEAQGFAQTDLPARIHLSEEKSPTRIVGETLAILLGLPALRRRWALGCYRKAPAARGLTADDWGLSPGVNDGIIELARDGVINRVSLMPNCEYLEYRLAELKALPGVELGLHLNLTHGTPLSRDHRAVSPARYLMAWLMPDRGGKRRQAARAELEAQLSRLDAAGARVVYMDGHHHIHLVPGLIDAVADVLKARGIRRVRLPLDPALIVTPRFPLVILSWLARSRLAANGFESRPCYYPKAGHFMDQGLLRARLARNQGCEIIVHPALIADVHRVREPDSYSDGRVTEFLALRMLATGRVGDPVRDSE